MLVLPLGLTQSLLPPTHIFLGNGTVFLHLQLQCLNKQLPILDFVSGLATEPWQPPNWPVDSLHPSCPLLTSASSAISAPSINDNPLGLFLDTSLPPPHPMPVRHQCYTLCLLNYLPSIIFSSPSQPQSQVSSTPPWTVSPVSLPGLWVPTAVSPTVCLQLFFPKHFHIILLFFLHQRPVK